MKIELNNVLILLMMITITSCTKEGLGGNATIVANVSHHEVPIKGATVCVKFNAKELPGANPSDYDLTVTGSDSESLVRINGLEKGDYYLYAFGYDSTIQQNVQGGLYVKIQYSERKSEKSVSLGVTE